jgi:hypothetical protein
MKALQALAVFGLVCFGIGGLSGAASAAPLAGASALHAKDTGSLVIEVRNGRNGALAVGAVLGVLGAAAVASSIHHDDDYYYRRRHHRHYSDDDDDYVPVRCRYGSYTDYRGVRVCRP